jgi:hypothetical protein
MIVVVRVQCDCLSVCVSHFSTLSPSVGVHRDTLDTVVSTLSAADYFASKMSELKAICVISLCAFTQPCSVEMSSEPAKSETKASSATTFVGKKSKKRSRSDVVDKGNNGGPDVDAANDAVDADECKLLKKKRKQEKKARRAAESASGSGKLARKSKKTANAHVIMREEV